MVSVRVFKRATGGRYGSQEDSECKPRRSRRWAGALVVSAKDSQQGSADRRLLDLGIQLPAAPTPFGTYVETVQTGNLLFFSGMLPVVDHKPKFIGRLGKELDVENGRAAAYTAALSVLAAAKKHLGSLDRVTRVVRLGVFLATSGDFFEQPKVADVVSDLFRDVFGIEKTSVRLIIGVASLPLGVPVELDVIFEVEE
jgi:enamine deaminase RidA (YjgF/YER057c/UK114 family)